MLDKSVDYLNALSITEVILWGITMIALVLVNFTAGFIIGRQSSPDHSFQKRKKGQPFSPPPPPVRRADGSIWTRDPYGGPTQPPGPT